MDFAQISNWILGIYSLDLGVQSVELGIQSLDLGIQSLDLGFKSLNLGVRCPAFNPESGQTLFFGPRHWTESGIQFIYYRCGHNKLCSAGTRYTGSLSHHILMVVGGNEGGDSASHALELLTLDPDKRTDCLKDLMHLFPARIEGAMGTTMGR